MKNNIIVYLIVIAMMSISTVVIGQIQITNVVGTASLTNCSGMATVSANGTAGPFTYTWSNGQNTTTAYALCAGLHTVTVTNAYGCETPITVNIEVDCNPMFNFSITADIKHSCDGRANGNITNVRGIGGYSPKHYSYTYLWNDGSTNDYRGNLYPGYYCVTVTNHHYQTGPKCEQVRCFVIQENTPTIQVNNVEKACFGQSTGSIDISTTGSATNMYNYLWSNGSNNEDISNISAGTYTVTSTDNSGCATVKQIEVLSYPKININYTLEDACPGSNNGLINTSVSGGTPPYTYTWSNGVNTSNLTNITKGYYSLTVTDNLGCTQDIGMVVKDATVTEVPASDCRYANLMCKGNIIGTKFYGTYTQYDAFDCRYLNEYCVLTTQYLGSIYIGTTRQYNAWSCTVDEVCANGAINNTHFGSSVAEYISGVDNWGPYCAYIEYCDFTNTAIGGYVMNTTSYNQEYLAFTQIEGYNGVPFNYCTSNTPVYREYWCDGSPLYYTCGPMAMIEPPTVGETMENSSNIGRLASLKGEFIEATTGYFETDIRALLSISNKTEVPSTELNKIRSSSKVYPNPFNEEIRVELTLETNEDLSISLVNILGEIITSRNYILSNGKHILTINTEKNLPKGIYFLNIGFGNKTREVFKLVH